ncbi:EamA family transporter [Desulfothermobacter acidiphilus]|uniref:EamA family transporter n=1 Tax=Desulfothermobacter acidiphilus TaxID=1938353 RepID=UPI003F8C4C23
MAFRYLALILLNACLLVAGQVLWKIGLQATGLDWWRLLTNSKVWIGFLAFGLATLIWFQVLDKVPLSRALPVQSIAYVLGVLAGCFFFHEAFSWARWLGVALIVGGICLVAR